MVPALVPLRCTVQVAVPGDETMAATMSTATCNPACWYAREPICRCSCGGANHGCLLHAGAEQPVRTRRIRDRWFELAAVGTRTELRQADPCMYAYDSSDEFRSHHVVIATASDDQIAKWPELAAYRSVLGDRWHPAIVVVWCEQGWHYRPGEVYEYTGKYGLRHRTAAFPQQSTRTT